MAAPYRQTHMPRPLPGCEQPTLTSHACTRAGQRSFSRAEIEYVLTHGRVIRRTGIRFYFLAARDVPLPDRRSAWVQRLVGATLLVDARGSDIITLYKNPDALRTIRRKSKYRLTRPS